MAAKKSQSSGSKPTVTRLPVKAATSKVVEKASVQKSTSKKENFFQPLIGSNNVSSQLSWYSKMYDRFIAYYGFQNRPDLIYFLKLLLLVALILLSCKFWNVYDRRFGYLGGLKTKIKVFKTMGLSGIFSLKKPMTASQLESYFTSMRQAGKLENVDIWRIKTLAAARQAHDAYFALRPDFKDHNKSLYFQMARLMAVQLFQIAAIVMPYFLAGYVIWALLKYFTFWTKASLGFLLEVQYKFIIDWIKAEISKIFAEIVNTIVKILTLGIKKGKAITVSMPTYSTYVNAWWKKYIKPLLDNVDDEYGCRVDEAKRSVAKAVGWIVLPLKTIYTWYLQLKKYGLDLPYDAFKEMVLRLYPQYVEQHGRLADDLAALDKNFYAMLKRDVIRKSRHSEKNTAKHGSTREAASPSGSSAQSIDLRPSSTEEPIESCAIIK